MARAIQSSSTPTTGRDMRVGGRRSRLDPLTIALIGVILQYVWRIQEIFPVLAKFQYTALISVAAIGLFAMQTDPTRRITNLRHRLYKPILAIFCIAVLSVPTSVHVGASFTFLTSNFLKTVILIGIVAASIRDRHDLDRLVRVFVLGGAGYVAAAIAVTAGSGGRLAAQGSYDPNDLGLYTVSTIPLCIYLMRRRAGWGDRLIGAVCMVLLLIGSVQSGSRGGFLALVVVVIYGLLALKAIKSSKRFTVVVAAVGLFLTFAGDAYWERMRTILAPKEDYNWSGQAESGRVEIWKRGLGYMAKRPITGVGVDQFSIAEGTLSPQAKRQQLGIGFKWSAAHNSYIQIGAEIGIFGLVAFVAMLGMAFLEARSIGRIAPGPDERMLGQIFGAMIVGFVVGCVFLSQAYGTYLYFMLALLMGLSRIVTRERAMLAHMPAGVSYAVSPPLVTKRTAQVSRRTPVVSRRR